jgi:hypothetical protein
MSNTEACKHKRRDVEELLNLQCPHILLFCPVGVDQSRREQNKMALLVFCSAEGNKSAWVWRWRSVVDWGICACLGFSSSKQAPVSDRGHSHASVVASSLFWISLTILCWDEMPQHRDKQTDIAECLLLNLCINNHSQSLVGALWI